MYWILQDSFHHDRAWLEFQATLDRFDQEWSKHKIVPFIGEIVDPPNIDTNNVMCWGSYSMRHTAKKNGWVPGVYDLDDFDFTVQVDHWGRNMLNYDSQVVELSDVHIDSSTFIRPIADSKSFTGKVFTPSEFYDFQSKIISVNADELNGKTKVQVCSPKEIYQEVRCWIVDGRCVTASLYKVGNRVLYSSNVDARFMYTAKAMVSAISIDCWNPVHAFCLDLADTPDGIKIIEINTINSSGFYAADLNLLVGSLI